MAKQEFLALLRFQSTLPYGSDPQANIRRSVFDNFNPRSLTGATEFADLPSAVRAISIHAPLRERLQYGDTTLLPDYISIHAPLRERQASHNTHIFLHTFQSTLPYGSDAGPFCGHGRAPVFQSTLPYGSDETYQ